MWLLLLFLSPQAHAMASLDRAADGQLILSASSCEEVKETEAAFVSWTKLLGEVPGTLVSPAIANGRCAADVTNLLPAIVNQRHRKEIGSGPNCWDTTLLTRGMIDSPRFASAAEFSFWLASPFCRELKPDERAQPGDLIALRSLEESKPVEIHGMTFLTDELTWSKNSPASESAYAVQRSELVYQTFHVYGCQREHGVDHKCAAWGNVYRCESPKSAREDAMKKNSRLAEIRHQLELLEKAASLSLENSLPIDEPNFRKSLEAVNAMIQGQMPSSDFFWQAAFEEGQSLLAQDRMFRKKR
jgi:hypothetical protein